MKSLKNIGLWLFSLAFLVAGCDYTEFDAVAPDTNNLAPWRVNTTIAQLKSEYLTGLSDLDGNPLFQYNTIEKKEDVVICGRVISSDIAGNVYKYIVIQDTVSGEALKISIDASGLSAVYPQGQMITVKCNNMTLGYYADMIQLGRVTYDSKKGYVVGRMPRILADAQIVATGMPDKKKMIVKKMTIGQILESDASVQGRLVVIDGCEFTMHGADFNKPTDSPLPVADRIFAPSTGGIGFPQSREVVDGTGSIFVSTSEYARFATTRLPTGKGSITAIVGYYNDKDIALVEGKIYYQLTLNSLKDLGSGFVFPQN